MVLRGVLDVDGSAGSEAQKAARDGVQVLVEDLGAGGKALVELSHRTAPVPGGGPGNGCDQRRDRWREWPEYGVYRYENRSGALPGASCAPGSAGGLRSVQVRGRAGARAGVEIRITFDRLALGALVGPLRATVVLGSDEAAARDGTCGVREYRSEQCRRGPAGNVYVCR
jgi:hypothetical protein